MLGRFFFTILVASCITGCASAHEWSGPRNVLFVGNSFTYYNNSLHNHYRALLRSALPEAAAQGRARIMTISGGRLPEHRGGLAAMLDSEDWDVVVLQGHSRGPIEPDTAGAFRQAARDYARLIRDSGAEPVFFMTWAYTDKPEMTALLDAAYTDIGRELGARVVPVGLAFARVTAERPDIALRTADTRHPSPAGTYLAACTFFAALLGRSPQGIEYTAGLDADVAAYLQQLAWQTAVEYERRGADQAADSWKSYKRRSASSSNPSASPCRSGLNRMASMSSSNSCERSASRL